MQHSTILKQTIKQSLLINPSLYSAYKQLPFNDKIDHLFCGCIHCMNNTKPIHQEIYPRITSTLQYQLSPVQAYNFIITKMVNYPGRVLLPQVYIVEDPRLVWYNSLQEKVKIKQGVSAMDVKKHFDSKKQKYMKAKKNRNLSIALFGMSLAQSFNPKANKNIISKQNHQSLNLTNNPSWLSKKNTTQSQPKQTKEVAIVNYTNCFSQIVTDPLLTKYLAKRKNDSFWSQVSTIVLIPPYKEAQLTFHQFNYYRNSRVLTNLQKTMNIMAKIVDKQKQNSVNPETDHLTGVQNSQEKQQNQNYQLQKKQNRNSPKQTLKTFFKSINLSSFSSLQKCSQKQKQKSQQNNAITQDKKTIQIMSYELIAYMQIMYHVRILEARMKYIIDHQQNCYLMDIDKFIATPLKDTEKFMVHDRFKPLDEIFLDEIAGFKISLNIKEEEQFKTNLAELVADCLEKRKTELNNCVYNRPSKEKLILIFQKIFPTFRQKQFFNNLNWRNQIKQQLQNFRREISKIIRSDEGIRILKRFGIQFYRTWD